MGKLVATSHQSLLEQARHTLGEQRFTVTLAMSQQDLHRTYSVAYQQFKTGLAEALQNMLIARSLKDIPPHQERTGRIQELREKNCRDWTPAELEEWFFLWQ